MQIVCQCILLNIDAEQFTTHAMQTFLSSNYKLTACGTGLIKLYRLFCFNKKPSPCFLLNKILPVLSTFTYAGKIQVIPTRIKHNTHICQPPFFV